MPTLRKTAAQAIVFCKKCFSNMKTNKLRQI